MTSKGAGKQQTATAGPAIVKDFVDLIKPVKAVHSIWYSDEEDGLLVVTVLDKQPWDKAPRSKVYKAERVAQARHPDELVDFQLYNLSEYPANLRPAPGGYGMSQAYCR